MIYLFLFLNSLFAQSETGYISGALHLYDEPTLVYEVKDNGSGSSSGKSSGGYAAEKQNMENLVRNQERQAREFTQKYIERETVRMNAAEAQVKKNLVSTVATNSANFGSKTKSIDQFRMYVDSAESLKTKIDGYNQSVNLGTRNFRAGVEKAESIIYSNLSGNFPKGFAESGIFVPEKLDSTIPKSPFSNFKPNHGLNTQPGQIVRRMANQYQASWGENSFFLQRSYDEASRFMLGASYVKLADEKFSANPMQAMSYLQMAKNILDFSEGVINGAKDNIKNIVNMVPELGGALKDYAKAVANDPAYFLSSTYSLIMATPRLGAALANHLKDQIDVLRNGTAYEKGQIIGEYSLDILGAIVSGGASGSTVVAKSVMKEFAEEVATNPQLQKVIATELIPAVQEAAEISNTLKNASKADTLRAIELNQTLKSTGRVKVTSEALEYSQNIKTKGGDVEWNHSILIKDLNKVRVQSAEEANYLSKVAFEKNPSNAGRQYLPSIKPNVKVFEYTAHAPNKTKFGHVYADKDSSIGSWILDKDSIINLSRAQIQDKFALPRLPMYIADVHIPAGTVMRKSVPNAIFGSSGKQVATQFEIVVEKLPPGTDLESILKNHRELP